MCICSNQVLRNFWNNASYKTTIQCEPSELDTVERSAWEKLLQENSLCELPNHHFVVYGELIEGKYFECDREIFEVPASLEDVAWKVINNL